MRRKLALVAATGLVLGVFGVSAQALVIGPVKGATYGAQLPGGGPFVELIVAKNGKSAHARIVCGSQIQTTQSRPFTYRRPDGGVQIVIVASPGTSHGAHGTVKLTNGLFVGHKGERAVRIKVRLLGGFTQCRKQLRTVYLILGHKAPALVHLPSGDTPNPNPTPPPVTPTPTPGTGTGTQQKEAMTLSCGNDKYVYTVAANTTMNVAGTLTPAVANAPVHWEYSHAGHADQGTVLTDASGNFALSVNAGPKASGALAAAYAGDKTHSTASQGCAISAQ